MPISTMSMPAHEETEEPGEERDDSAKHCPLSSPAVELLLVRDIRVVGSLVEVAASREREDAN
ncbi:MAG: hypothetical protein Q7S65_01660 [Nanoarchaeota archaeon]|nr:hypothetical protein [Nanoarchaeota archaeon]